MVLVPDEVRDLLRKFPEWLTWSSSFRVLISPFCGEEECAAKAWQQAKTYRGVSQPEFEPFEEQTEKVACDYCGKQIDEGLSEAWLTLDGSADNTNFILEMSDCCSDLNCLKKAWEEARRLVVVDVEMVEQ